MLVKGFYFAPDDGAGASAPTDNSGGEAIKVDPVADSRDGPTFMDVLAQVREEETPAATEPPKEGEDAPKDNEPGAGEDKGDDAASDGQGDDPVENLPGLDDAIKEALKDNPELEERWSEQWRGLVKREEKAAEREAALAVDEAGFSTYQKIEAELLNPAEAGKALRAIANVVCEMHGVTLESLFEGAVKSGDANASSSEPVGPNGLNPDADTEYEKQGFDSAFELQIARQLKALEDERAAEKRGRQAEAERIRSEAEAKAAELKHKEFMEKTAPGIAKKLSVLHSGWDVSKEMISTAVKKFPSLDPADAVEAAYPRALAKHLSGVAAKQHEKPAPDLVRSAVSPGGQAKKREDVTFRDVLAQVQAAG